MEAYAVYKFPNEPYWYSVTGKVRKLETGENKNTKGFIFSCFDTNEVYCIEGEDRLHENFPSDFEIPKYALGENAVVAFEQYTTAVSKAIQAVEENTLQKVVITRNAFFEKDMFTFSQKLEQLSQSFPEAFVYGLHSPSHGNWFGASPEVLLTKTETGFQTMALAGTVKSEHVLGVNDFSAKEINEQAYVAQHITKMLQEQNINVEQGELHVLHTGQLNHLCTKFNFDVQNQNMLDLANVLHPTPAICGLPVNKAKMFIALHEAYKRDLYTGYLGPVGLQKSGLFVNLRCGQVFTNGMLLYAGGGINKGSVIEKEIAESGYKMENLLRFF